MMSIQDLTAFVEGRDADEATTSPTWLERNREDQEKLTNAIQTHTAAKGVTDLQGKITFAPVPPGSYYIVGWSTTRKQGEVIIWNYRATVKAGTQKISLSSSDAAAVEYFLPPLGR